MDEADLRRLAEQILPALPELLGEPVATTVAAELRAALAEAGGDAVLSISTVLSRHDATRAWIRDRLPAAHPEEAVRAYSPLASRDVRRRADRYVCPACGYQWFRPTVDDDVPVCSQGHEPRRLTAAAAE